MFVLAALAAVAFGEANHRGGHRVHNHVPVNRGGGSGHGNRNPRNHRHHHHRHGGRS